MPPLSGSCLAGKRTEFQWHLGSPLSDIARCKMVKFGKSIKRSPPVNARRSMSIAVLLAQFKKFPLKASLHVLFMAFPDRENLLYSSLV